MPARIVASVLAMALLVACKSNTVPTPASMGALTESEARILGAELIDALGGCDEAALAALIDREWMFRTAAHRSEGAASEKRRQYAMLKTREHLGRDLLCIPGAPQLAYLGTREASFGQAIVIRSSVGEPPDDIVTYYEFAVGKGKDQQPRCLDRLDYQSGWTTTAMLATGANADAVAESLAKTHRSLPGDLKRAAVVAAASIGDAQYKEELADFLSRNPRDLSVYLQSYPGLASRGSYALADQAIVALQQGTRDEVGLLTTRVSLLTDAERFDVATELAEAALLANPDDKEAHYRLLEVHALARNFAGAVAVMRLLGERFNVRFTEEGMDTTHPAYVELLASDEWAAY